jgi:glycine cleavage system H protein
MFDVPDDRRYAASHEWALETTDGTIRVGISDFAQDELGDIVFVEFPDEGDAFDAGDAFGVVESIKAVSDLYAPVSGRVVATNDAVLDAPELVNDDPFGEGWLIELETDDSLDDLLSATAYEDEIA